MPQLRVLSASIVLALGLSACGGGGSSGPDSSGQTTPTQTASATQGTLVDDVIVGGTVFCDGNGNKTLDAGESVAVTDDAGKYTFDKACFAEIISVAGTGFDKTTLKAPKGQFRAKAGSSVISPFTTMYVESGLSEAEFKAVLTRLGLGDVDVANFDPTKDSARATTAAAIAKMLNDVTEIIAIAGGDPAAAFKAATSAVAKYLVGAAMSGSAFDSSTSLAGLVGAAVEAGFAAGNKGADGKPVWSDKALGNVKLLASNGIATMAGNIRKKASLAEAGDDLSSGSIVHLIGDTDLEDDAKVAEGVDKAKDSVQVGKPQYVYVANDAVQIVPLQGQVQSYTVAQFDAGLSLTGQTLATLDRVMLPLSTTARGLPSRGVTVSLAIEIENQSTGGIMQAAVDKVLLKPNADGTVSATLKDSSVLHLYMKTAAGIEIGTGATGFDSLNSPILSTDGGSIGIDLQKLAGGMRKRFPDNVALIDKVLHETGSFKVRMVINELDFRHADGSRFGIGKVQVRVPGSTEIAKKVGGIVVSGVVTF